MLTVNAKTVNEQVTGESLPIDKAALLNAALKNAQSIVCRRCDTVIIAENMIAWHEGHGRKLARMSVAGAAPVGEDEVNEWWHTSDECAFEAVGSLKLNSEQMLLCAGCEFGPFGFIDGEDNFVAAGRVNYK